MHDLEPFLCAALRGEDVPWPTGEDGFAAAFLARSAYHGVQALLHARVRRQPVAMQTWPVEVTASCRTAAVGQTMWELRHQHLLTTLLARLARVGVRPVLFKGTALAYGLYPEPALRTRGDTDFIVAPDSVGALHQELLAMAFGRDMAVSGEFISYQANYTWMQVEKGHHTLDVHWRINNSELLSRLFTHQELLEKARPLQELGPHAMAAAQVHALLLACMHRASHKQNPYYVDGVAHWEGDRLIWLYDIHLLLGVLTPAELDEFVQLARAKGLCAVCLDGIEMAQACFHTSLPAGLLAALAPSGPVEPPARYLSGGRWLQKWMDFQALGGLRNRARYAHELLFPSADYMRQKFPDAVPGALVWLYMRRAAGGVFKMRRGREEVNP